LVEQSNKLIGNYGEFLKYSTTFVETGSCYGRSIQMALDAGYQLVKSVEAKWEFYQHCKAAFKTKPNVLLYYGKSIDQLPDMLIDIINPAVFWLDAHVSGEQSAGYQDWVEKGENSDYDQHKILKAELHLVLTNNNKHILLIDDQNGPNTMNEEYIDIIKSYNPEYKFYWYDEQMGEMFYKDKILVAIP
jgi:hypothetical protein